MNKLGILAIAIAGAFLIGILSANPVVEAVGGWKPAVDDLQSQIDAITSLESPTTYVKVKQHQYLQTSTSVYDVDCDPGDIILGGGWETDPGLLGGNVNIFSSFPPHVTANTGTWFIQLHTTDINIIQNGNVNVRAICLDLTP